jgi:HAE1 family hydrophobic/amphiphilic exporter-1
LRPGTPLEVTDQAVSRVQMQSEQLPNLALSYAVAGTGNRLDANPVDAGENTRPGQHFTRSWRDSRRRRARNRQLRTSLQQNARRAASFSRPSLFALSTPLEVVITGYDLDRLGQAAEGVHTRMLANPLFRDVRSTVEAGNPEIQIVFDQERATSSGWRFATSPTASCRACAAKSLRATGSTTRRSTCSCAASTRTRRRSRRSAA